MLIAIGVLALAMNVSLLWSRNQVYTDMIVVEMDTRMLPKDPGFAGRILLVDRIGGKVLGNTRALRYCPGAISSSQVVALDPGSGDLLFLSFRSLAQETLSPAARIRAPKGISRWWLNAEGRLSCNIKPDPPTVEVPEWSYDPQSSTWVRTGRMMPEDLIPEFVAGKLRLRHPQRGPNGVLFVHEEPTSGGQPGSDSFSGKLPGWTTHVYCAESGLRIDGDTKDAFGEVKTTVVRIWVQYPNGARDRFRWKRVGTFGDVFLIFNQARSRAK